jgi:aminomethyltransferase
MPVQYRAGIIAEHRHTRQAASFFDVSHMGQVAIRGDGAADALERLVPADIRALDPGRMRYTQLTNEAGGIIDDLMVTNVGDYLFAVVNASRKAEDLGCLRAGLPRHAVDELDRVLFAVQGPAAAGVLARFAPGSETLPFMAAAPFVVDGCPLAVTRSGYTGEDGFEISVPAADAERIARMLLAFDDVAPAGLGARDSLRLEAGLCLYGSDIDQTTTPVEAGLSWAIQKVRRTGGARAGGFPGASRILGELENGATRKRVGLLPDGRAPMRAHTALFASEVATEPVGEITSGAFGPSIEQPMSMGYLPTDLAAPGTKVFGEVRGKRLPATVAPLPFYRQSYKR